MEEVQKRASPEASELEAPEKTPAEPPTTLPAWTPAKPPVPLTPKFCLLGTYLSTVNIDCDI